MIEEILVDSNEEIFNAEIESQQAEGKMQLEECVVEEHACNNNVKFGNVLFNKRTKVFAKINSQGYVINVQSDVVLEDTTGWILIDEGVGDRFVFAHTEYFGRPLTDEFGNYQIKFERQKR